ncbi:MAG: 4Fe-4S binding protein, partial [Clostridia bacterium]|nr:4Fe-4S binding protein [Clostridia bacterium]
MRPWKRGHRRNYMIKIDQGKCIGCLKCVAVCPFNVLKIKDG